jgi:hypothetical protein
MCTIAAWWVFAGAIYFEFFFIRRAALLTSSTSQSSEILNLLLIPWSAQLWNVKRQFLLTHSPSQLWNQSKRIEPGDFVLNKSYDWRLLGRMNVCAQTFQQGLNSFLCVSELQASGCHASKFLSLVDLSQAKILRFEPKSTLSRAKILRFEPNLLCPKPKSWVLNSNIKGENWELNPNLHCPQAEILRIEPLIYTVSSWIPEP